MFKNLVVFFFVCCFSHHALSEIVLITGASKNTGFRVAHTLVSDASGRYIVYAGLKPSSHRGFVNTLLAKYPTRMRVIDLDMDDNESLITAIKTIISREGRIDTILNFGKRFAPSVQAMIPHMRSQKSARILEILSDTLKEDPELLERIESI